MNAVLYEELFQQREHPVPGLVGVEVNDGPFLKRLLEGFGIGVGAPVTFNGHAFIHGGADEFLQDGPRDRAADVDFTRK